MRCLHSPCLYELLYLNSAAYLHYLGNKGLQRANKALQHPHKSLQDTNKALQPRKTTCYKESYYPTIERQCPLLKTQCQQRQQRSARIVRCFCGRCALLYHSTNNAMPPTAQFGLLHNSAYEKYCSSFSSQASKAFKASFASARSLWAVASFRRVRPASCTLASVDWKS